jgi:hypothetical protein
MPYGVGSIPKNVPATNYNYLKISLDLFAGGHCFEKFYLFLFGCIEKLGVKKLKNIEYFL